jgi:hypothetical protein
MSTMMGNISFLIVSESIAVAIIVNAFNAVNRRKYDTCSLISMIGGNKYSTAHSEPNKVVKDCKEEYK